MKPIILVSLTAFALVFLQSCTKQSEISQFRGDRTGIYYETDLLKKWPADGPEEVFRVDSIGDGYGSPVISGDLMYVTGAVDSLAMLYCFDLSGEMKWKVHLGKEWTKNYPGSRSSPTVVDNLIYVATGFGNLYCINKDSQNIIWEKSLQNDFQGILPLFGHSESPCVHDDMVFWTAGGKEFNVVAIDRFTGDLKWSSKAVGERSGYNHPRVIETRNGNKILVTFSAYHLMGFDIESGNLLWTHEQDNYPVSERKPGVGDTHANTIIFDNGYIYYVAGDGNCAVKLAISEDGSVINEIWRNKDFDSYMGGVIMLDDFLYSSGTARPFLLSMNAETGMLSDSLQIGRGAIIAADSMIYYYSQTGKVHLISYHQGNITEISSFRINEGTGEHFSHPLIHNKILYVRRGNSIMGYKISTA